MNTNDKERLIKIVKAMSHEDFWDWVETVISYQDILIIIDKWKVDKIKEELQYILYKEMEK